MILFIVTPVLHLTANHRIYLTLQMIPMGDTNFKDSYMLKPRPDLQQGRVTFPCAKFLPPNLYPSNWVVFKLVKKSISHGLQKTALRLVASIPITSPNKIPLVVRQLIR